jgi:hypothetical protein
MLGERTGDVVSPIDAVLAFHPWRAIRVARATLGNVLAILASP